MVCYLHHFSNIRVRKTQNMPSGRTKRGYNCDTPPLPVKIKRQSPSYSMYSFSTAYERKETMLMFWVSLPLECTIKWYSSRMFETNWYFGPLISSHVTVDSFFGSTFRGNLGALLSQRPMCPLPLFTLFTYPLHHQTDPQLLRVRLL